MAPDGTSISRDQIMLKSSVNHFRRMRMKPTIQAVKGTREFYPEEMAVRQWLYSKIRSVSESFGYCEYDGPFLEKIDLYAAKSGDELVKEQAFVFPDRGGDLITLRPELTPSLARMIAQKQGELVFPARWWSFGPFWRYEKPQKGRSREFFQWNIDQIGANSPEADAEMVAICATFFRDLGFTPREVKIMVNHRGLMDEEISKLGIAAEKHKAVTRLIDRRDKMPPAAWEKAVMDEGFTETQLDQLKALLSDEGLWKKSGELQRFFIALESMGVSEYVSYDPRIIRGLDYYTGIVFEAWDVGGDGRAVLGGGHYDNLVADVGGEALPGVGFAMGDVMVTLLLQKYGKIPPFKLYENTILVTIFDESLRPASLSMASNLRNHGFHCICYSESARLQKQLKYADRLGVPVVLVMGPDELQNNQVTIKDLRKHDQKTVSQGDIVTALNQVLGLEVS